MPYVRRKYIRKRRGRRANLGRGLKSKVFKRKVRYMGKKANIGMNLYYFKRKVAPGRQVNLTTDQLGQLSFSLNQVPGVTDFTALFDQYMISGVKVDFRLILDPSAAAAGSATYPNLYVRRDYDNTANETVQDIAQDNKSKRFILQPNKTRSIYLKPAVQAEYFNVSTALTSSSPQWNKWIDCSNSSYPHLGLKWAIDTMGILLTPGNTMDIEFTYYLKMKNTR